MNRNTLLDWLLVWRRETILSHWNLTSKICFVSKLLDWSSCKRQDQWGRGKIHKNAIRRFFSFRFSDVKPNSTSYPRLLKLQSPMRQLEKMIPRLWMKKLLLLPMTNQPRHLLPQKRKHLHLVRSNQRETLNYEEGNATEQAVIMMHLFSYQKYWLK